MFCPECGEKLAENKKFCGKCGASIQGGDGSKGKSKIKKVIGWLLVVVGIAIPIVIPGVAPLAVLPLWIGFTMVMSGKSFIIRTGKGLVAMIVVFGAVFFLPALVGTVDPVGAEPDMSVELREILADYESGNEVVADDKYKGKLVRTEGVVREVGKDIVDDPFVIVGSSFIATFPELQCSFARSAEHQAASLSPGQTVVIQGKVKGLSLHVQAVDCTIVLPEEQVEVESADTGTIESLDSAQPVEAEASEWQSGWRQGVTEYAVSTEDGSYIRMSCPDDAVAPAKILVGFSGQSVANPTLVIDGDEFNIEWVMSDCRVCEDNYRAMWQKLRSASRIAVSSPDGVVREFPANGLANILPTEPCPSAYSVGY